MSGYNPAEITPRINEVYPEARCPRCGVVPSNDLYHDAALEAGEYVVVTCGADQFVATRIGCGAFLHWNPEKNAWEDWLGLPLVDPTN